MSKTLTEQKIDCLRRVVQTKDNWTLVLQEMPGSTGVSFHSDKKPAIPPMKCRQKRKYLRAWDRYQKHKAKIDAQMKGVY